MSARYRVHRMLQELVDPAKAAAFLEQPEIVYQQYQLNEEEKAALRDGSFAALGAIGVHPLLQMTLMFRRNAQLSEDTSIKYALDELLVS